VNDKVDIPNLKVEREAFGFYRTWWDEIEDLYADGAKDAIADLVIGICRYAFDGADFESPIGEVRRSLMGKKYAIDKQIERYAAASEDGKKSRKVTDEQIYIAIASGQFTTQAALAKHLFISPQAISKRFAHLGIKIGDVEEAQKRLNELNPEREDEEA
jgi:hypothetical protein